MLTPCDTKKLRVVYRPVRELALELQAISGVLSLARIVTGIRSSNPSNAIIQFRTFMFSHLQNRAQSYYKFFEYARNFYKKTLKSLVFNFFRGNYLQFASKCERNFGGIDEVKAASEVTIFFFFPPS